MSMQRSISSAKARALLFGVAVCAWILSGSTALGQGHGGGGRHNSADKPADSESKYTPLPAPPPVTPHGGDYISTQKNYYEVVYMPFQTRIYLFDSNLKPLSAQDVHVQMSLQLPTENAQRQIPFQFVAMPKGATEQDYVVAVFDIRPLQDKEANITFEFSGLSDRRFPTASFTPHYARFSVRPYVSKVLLTEADRDGIARQRVCPVSGAPLGSRGPVTKLYVAEFPLYVAGDDCIEAVKASPARFLPQPGR